MSAESRLLPSDLEWISVVVDRLIDGEVLLVRGLPRTGKSVLCSAIAHQLGESAVLLEGGRYAEDHQAELRAQLENQIASKVSAHGCAQLIFDDYGKAIRRSQGGALHSFLYRVLIDGKHARDIGALLTSRFSDDLHLGFSGSPLLSRAQTITQPRLADADAAELGVSLPQLRSLVGNSTALAARIQKQSAGSAIYALVEHLKANEASLVRDLPSGAVEVLMGAREFDDVDAISKLALSVLGNRLPDGSFAMAQVVIEAGLASGLSARNPGWPATRSDSVERFVRMLAGIDSAIWVDRYLFADLPSLRSFLVAVRAKTQTRLRLLGSHDRASPRSAEDVADALETIGSVEARMMTGSDRRQLHDRHLVLPASRSGFVLPTAGVILGLHDPGSAVAVRMPTLAVNYSEYWRRATRCWPTRSLHA